MEVAKRCVGAKGRLQVEVWGTEEAGITASGSRGTPRTDDQWPTFRSSTEGILKDCLPATAAPSSKECRGIFELELELEREAGVLGSGWKAMGWNCFDDAEVGG